MIKNIPNKYTQTMLLETLDRRQKDQYDFFYLPIDLKNGCNVGYAFINFINSVFIIEFYQQFNNKSWECFNSDKICKLTYGRIQGKQALENNFANMNAQEVSQTIKGGSLTGQIKVRPLILSPPLPSDEEIEKYTEELKIKMQSKDWSKGSKKMHDYRKKQ